MKCDFEKEFEELRRKYEIKFKELEGEFLEARKNQDITLKFVYAHKILADALMAKYPKVMQQGNCSYPYAVCSNCGNAYAIYYSLDYKVFFTEVTSILMLVTISEMLILVRYFWKFLLHNPPPSPHPQASGHLKSSSQANNAYL